ncbi:glycoside hydrolase family 5 protein [Suhomyces tanzawaensis NRRL Y-17324]|uniref:Glycoside hydrolase family 5 protein n=1 Tax=Suhomyces tanzawaensis NRRL Y-17324 TaxID=984487 RepID=A0A1E4SD82_9ASCO|nr:glycoside hydrolase family 5 protein [Suhomyces tanzawaensis NRRL Y-17324]ODV77474.1 glycoside hydrolase family 5 protein [Suhomyces tanzawaensis NRRL Y-17324]
MFDKLKLKSKSSNITASEPVTPGQAPSKRQIYQSRRNFGVNLGACFVLEKWIYHSIFPEGAGCELEAVAKWTKDEGADGAKKRFEDHWNNYITEDDWKWLEDHEVTSVRVPLGYWEIGGGKFTKGTKFEPYSEVYSNAWDIFKKKFVETAANHSISVLVDIHGLPGGANGSDHSGEQSGGDAKFWNDEESQLLVLDLLGFVASDLKSYDNIAGIQIVNESEFADDPKKQTRYYGAAINLIREQDKEIPIVISDGWWPDQWAKWVQSKQGLGTIGVVVDHHCYRCFSDDDKKKAPDQIIGDLEKDLLTNITDDSKGVDYMVGEYSCVFDGASWEVNNSDNHRDQYVVDYGNRQGQLFAKRARFGSYFWTFKFESGNGGEWDFRTMVDKGAIRPEGSLKGKNVPDKSVFEEKLNNAFGGHTDYWSKTDPKGKYEHERFKEGFTVAWADASEFLKFNGSLIGRVETLKIARLQEHIAAKGLLKYLWEWEQGYDAGLKEFESSL